MKIPSLAMPLVSACLLVQLGGCGTTDSIKSAIFPSGLGLPWVPNAPGQSVEEIRAQRDGKPAPTPAAARAAQPAQGAQPRPSGQSWAAATQAAVAQTAAAPAPAGAARPGVAVAAAAANPVRGGYPQASRYGDMLFIAGQIALDPRTNNVDGDAPIDAQTRIAMDNVMGILEANALTMANVVSVTVYLKNINDLRAVDLVYERYFKGTLPARSVVEVARLPRGAAIEISAIAGR